MSQISSNSEVTLLKTFITIILIAEFKELSTGKLRTWEG